MSLKDELLEIIGKERKYAGFFDWPDKPLKERGVVLDLLESMGYSKSNPVRNLRPADQDPPDIVGDVSEHLVGFEVTELVDEAAARLNAQGHDVWRSWEKADVLQHIQQILKVKDSKTYCGGPYKRLALVIHTDEPLIDPRDFVAVIEEHRFVKPEKITEAYVLFSYEPGTQGYPVVKLAFES